MPQDAGEQSPSFTYDYGRAVFLAGIVTGDQAANWLRSPTGQVGGSGMQPTTYEFQMPQWHENVNWRKYRSYQPYDLTALPWPCMRYGVSYLNASDFQESDMDLLLSEGCPFFPNLQIALAQLVYGVKDWEQGQNLSPSDKAVVRIAQTEAWIQGIYISPTALTVTVAGTNTAGTRLEIVGPPKRLFYEVLKQEGPVPCPLPDGPPSRLWIVLSRDKEWLDCYEWNQQWAWMNRQQRNVTVEPPEWHTQIEALIAQGEGLTIDLKEVLPSEKDKWLKTIAAFANYDGGVIIVGVDDDGMIVGVPGDAAKINKDKDTISRMIRGNLAPCPEFSVENYEVEGKQVIAITVQKGPLPPYGIHPDKPEFYVRRGANSFPARRRKSVF